MSNNISKQLHLFPKDWKIRKLKEVCDILDNDRIPLSSAERNLIKGEYPYYGANGLVDKINKWIFDEKLILVAEDGGNFFEFANRPIAYRVDGKCWVNNHAHVLRPKSEYIFDYIFYLLEHKNIVPYINGSTRSKLNRGDLEEILLWCPKEIEQKKIAEILSTVDEQIEKTEQIIQETQRLKKGLMQKLFTEGIGHTKFKQTKIGRIPEEWKVVKFTNYVELKHGFQFRDYDFTDEGIPIVKIANLKDGSGLDFSNITYISQKRLYEFQEYQLKVDDILMALTGATLGKVSVISEDYGPILQNYRVGKFTPKNDKIDKNFLSHYLRSERLRGKMFSLINESAQPNVGKADFDKIYMGLPTKNEQKYISQLLNEVNNKIELEQKTKAELENLKKGLMQKLLTGKVRVKV